MRRRTVHAAVRRIFHNQSLAVCHAMNQNAVQGEQSRSPRCPVLRLHPEYLANASNNESIHFLLVRLCHHFDVHACVRHNSVFTPMGGDPHIIPTPTMYH